MLNVLNVSKHNSVVPIDELSFRSVVIRSRIERIKTFHRTDRISPDRRGRVESVGRTPLSDVIVRHEVVGRVVGRAHREPEVARGWRRRGRHVGVRRSQCQRSERSSGLDVWAWSGHEIQSEIIFWDLLNCFEILFSSVGLFRVHVLETKCFVKIM